MEQYQALVDELTNQGLPLPVVCVTMGRLAEAYARLTPPQEGVSSIHEAESFRQP
ncbi:hypothetical protein [Paenibacillus sp. FSL M7-0420]|uniref:hypothetical protein n=1 Tax=Paenibacillus sp. FSL M7-0420 TaxID=2921609 RepID=UPI0030FAE6E2